MKRKRPTSVEGKKICDFYDKYLNQFTSDPQAIEAELLRKQQEKAIEKALRAIRESIVLINCKTVSYTARILDRMLSNNV